MPLNRFPTVFHAVIKWEMFGKQFEFSHPFFSYSALELSTKGE